MRLSSKFKAVVFFMFLFFGIFLVWYTVEYSMEKAEEYEINSSKLPNRILIATQGSEFKNALTIELVKKLKNDSVFIKVIDISSLKGTQPESYNAIVIIHTWENRKPPKAVADFVEIAETTKLVVVTTSGQGDSKMKGIDAITGESRLEDAPIVVEKIKLKLEKIQGKLP
ncbi:hypothetical protein L1I30_05575 [Gillisia sp. M10.2A]|uniref:Uncharacterized protein n=1 Tax=Gillisia lutea TaxID=2909668 RepID=A0ABS9EE49_9FLAO|nr:hypothetical protein [Gillisia lutea]MCF4101126.1 hypothetical protein [Gillisia lutea]